MVSQLDFATSQEFAAEMLSSALSGAIDGMAPMGSETRIFLEGQIYPTLVPAMEALLKEVERCNGAGIPEPEPMDWLAAYLLRHNPKAEIVPVE